MKICKKGRYELLQRGCIIHVLRRRQRRDYKIIQVKPLDMFILTFKKDVNINKIFGITDILSMMIEIQQLKSSKLVPQCKRFQSYGHSWKYCKREPRYVKCTDKHLKKIARNQKEKNQNVFIVEKIILQTTAGVKYLRKYKNYEIRECHKTNSEG